MPIREIHNDIHPVPLFAPKAAVTDDTAQVSAIIDTLGFEACELVFVTGTNADADATFAVLVQDGDAANLSDAAAVDDAYLVGTEAQAAYTFADDGECRKIGYRGSKRYVRMTITPTGNTGNIFLAGVAVLGKPVSTPTATLS
ncbi:hypothetical protein [Sinorhizobium sp. BJ1]|uniref:hypothetical protein n=1 Tax=Sinorhizobium sp. BJ1 TaxID=2035455 RepID=UPI000BE9FD75|nr:hypothetical protein [Sinorhizobium sp. BJ1]PDT79962.1 hypothetical protein CO676_30410 [Sinorhizobium sp. BJ1]